MKKMIEGGASQIDKYVVYIYVYWIANTEMIESFLIRPNKIWVSDIDERE